MHYKFVFLISLFISSLLCGVQGTPNPYNSEFRTPNSEFLNTLPTVIHHLSTHDVDNSYMHNSVNLYDFTYEGNTRNGIHNNTLAFLKFNDNASIDTPVISKIEKSYPHFVNKSLNDINQAYINQGYLSQAYINQAYMLELHKGEYPIIINELQYQPVNNEPEWIEFFNRSDSLVELNNAYIRDAAGAIATFSASIEPFDYFIIVQNLPSFIAAHPLVDMSKVVEPTRWAVLNNTGTEIVELYLEGGIKVDSLSYVGVASMRGRSLERVNPWSDENISYTHSTAEIGSTPLAQNSVTPDAVEIKITDIKLTKLSDKVEHIVTIENTGFNQIFSADLVLRHKNEEAIAFEYLTEISIDQEQELVLYTVLPAEKGYHYYSYNLIYENKSDTHIKTLLNDHPPIVVNEIMFDPYSGEPEWIEFIKIRDVMPSEGLIFYVRDRLINLPYFSSEYALVTNTVSDSLYMRENYDIPADVPIFLRLGNLVNAGASLLLKDNDENIYEEFSYKPSFSQLKGISAERISPSLPPHDQNWVASPNKSTPGRRNSAYMNVIPTTNSLEITNSPFSPYRGENCLITIKIKEQQVRAEIKIFDLKGREIVKLADRQVVPGEYSFIWGGYDKNNKIVNTGVYPVYVFVETLGGKRLMQERKLIYVGW